MATVFANGRSILHKGDGNVQVCPIPDVCKTPSPGGPVPIPYVNVAKDGDLAKGTKKVKVEGQSAGLESSELSTSSGDEPGTAGGGIVSSKTKGKMTWATSSPDVRFEGKKVVRFLDIRLHNGNVHNTGGPPSQGGPAVAVGEETKDECPRCHEKPHEIPVAKERDESGEAATRFIAKLEIAFGRQREFVTLHRYANQKATELLHRANRLTSPTEKQRLLAEARSLQMRADAAEVALLAMGHVLRKKKMQKRQPPYYVGGYMTGAVRCRCPADPVRAIATSGYATPGFKLAAKGMKGYKLVTSHTLNGAQALALKALRRAAGDFDNLGKGEKPKPPNEAWSCAAPKLLGEAGGGGHKVQEFFERYFDPMNTSTTYHHGEAAPPCDRCSKLLPLALCDNKGPCK